MADMAMADESARNEVDCFINEGWSVYDQVMSLTCFVCLLGKQHAAFKQNDVISVFPVLQGSAETQR